jgi:FAD synthase
LVVDWTTQGIVDHGWVFVFPNNSLKPQPGIYFVEVEYQNTLFPALMHMNLNKKAIIYLTNKNDNLLGRRVFVHWHKKIRTIIKNSNDGVDVKDSNELKKIYKTK